MKWPVMALREAGLNLDWFLEPNKGPAWRSQINIQTSLEGLQRLMGYLFGECWDRCMQHIIDLLCSTTMTLTLDGFYVVTRIEAQLEAFASALGLPFSFEGRSGAELVPDFMDFMSVDKLQLEHKHQADFMEKFPAHRARLEVPGALGRFSNRRPGAEPSSTAPRVTARPRGTVSFSPRASSRSLVGPRGTRLSVGR